MKPLKTTEVEIFHGTFSITLEIEEYKRLFVVHFIDHRKYFSHLHTYRFFKSAFDNIVPIVDFCRAFALDRRFF